MKYNEDRRYCEWCGYEGLFSIVEYDKGEYHGTVLCICRCTNATITLNEGMIERNGEDFMPLKHAKSVIQFHKANVPIRV